MGAVRKTRAGRKAKAKAPARKTAKKPAKKAERKATRAAHKKGSAKRSPAGKRKAGTATRRTELKKRSIPAPDIEVDAEVLEFIEALDRYKKQHNRPFPSWSEVLHVLRSLGYSKR